MLRHRKQFGEVSVTANSTTTASLTIYTSESECNAAISSGTKGTVRYFAGRKAMAADSSRVPFPHRTFPIGIAIAGITLLGIRGKRVETSESFQAAWFCLLALGFSLGLWEAAPNSSSTSHFHRCS